jgi:hypothetical protein
LPYFILVVALLLDPASIQIIPAFAGVNLATGGQPHVALIERNFLQHFVLFYDGRIGHVSISDELPLT